MKSLQVMITTLALGLGMGMSGANAADGTPAVERLTAAGISEEVIGAYVENSNDDYALSSDDILRLERENVPDSVILQMLKHGGSGDYSSTVPLPTNSNNLTNPTNPTNPLVQSALATPSYPNVESGGNSYTPPVAPAPQATVPDSNDMNVSFFYQALAPEGTWHNDPSYGWVWTPAVAQAQSDWRPYAQDGHWTYTDQGWYWQSSYNWSWAAFHYGRWARSADYRWIWVPGTEWAPAWVNWRQSNDAYGWAPLPPEADFDVHAGFRFHGRDAGLNCDFGLRANDYAFVPCNRVLSTNIGSELLPQSRVTNIFNTSVTINNTYVYKDKHIVNEGLAVDRVAAQTHQAIRPVHLNDSRFSAGQPIPHEQRNGNTLAAFRPTIQPRAPITPAVIQERQAANAQKRADAATAAHQRVQEALAQRQATQAAHAADVKSRTDARQTQVQQQQQDRAAKSEAAQQKAQTLRAEQQKKAADQAAATKSAQELRQTQARAQAQQQQQDRAAKAEAAQRQAQTLRAEQQKKAADQAAAAKSAQELRQNQARAQAQQQQQDRAAKAEAAQRQAQTLRAEQQKKAADQAAATKAAQELRLTQSRAQAQQQQQDRAAKAEAAQQKAQTQRAEQQQQAATRAAAAKSAQEARQVKAQEQQQQRQADREVKSAEKKADRTRA